MQASCNLEPACPFVEPLMLHVLQTLLEVRLDGLDTAAIEGARVSGGEQVLRGFDACACEEGRHPGPPCGQCLIHRILQG